MESGQPLIPQLVYTSGLHAGAVALSRLVVSPFDRWKVLLQTSPKTRFPVSNLLAKSYRGVAYNVSGSVVFVASFSLSQSMMDNSGIAAISVSRGIATIVSHPLEVLFTRAAVRATLQSEKVPFRSLYAGISVGLLGVPFSVMGSLATLSFLGLVFPLPNVSPPVCSDVDFARGLGVGSVSALAGSVVAYPVDTLRRRMMTGEKLKSAIARGDFFRGLSIHCFKSVPEIVILTYGLMCNLRYFTYSIEED